LRNTAGRSTRKGSNSWSNRDDLQKLAQMAMSPGKAETEGLKKKEGSSID